ncbi:hypothetical protein ACLKA7_000679 [Drosophila subpalustris]
MPSSSRAYSRTRHCQAGLTLIEVVGTGFTKYDIKVIVAGIRHRLELIGQIGVQLGGSQLGNGVNYDLVNGSQLTVQCLEVTIVPGSTPMPPQVPIRMKIGFWHLA